MPQELAQEFTARSVDAGFGEAADAGAQSEAFARAAAGASGDDDGTIVQPPSSITLQEVVEAFRQDASIHHHAVHGRAASLRGSASGNGSAAPSSGGAGLGPVIGTVPGIYPEWLGSRSFCETCGSRFAYVVGEMARGIATSEMVIAAVRAGFVGFFGSAGLRPEPVRDAIIAIREAVGPDAAWGANLIHSPDHIERERQAVDVFLKEGVRNVSASGFMTHSRDMVRFSASGLARGADGEITRATRVFAKISRPEVAEVFIAPPPPEMLEALVAAGDITPEQADLQASLPVAEFITVESDSGGHTDGRPMTALFPVICTLRDRLAALHDYRRPVLLGAAGGIGTPGSAAAAFALGADYVVTGSINQSALESGLSDEGRAMIAEADLADTAMAPAADMFEIGAKVQVLKRGTMFPIKAQRLYDLYRRHEAVEQFSQKDATWLEKQVLRESFEDAWGRTRAYHVDRKPDLVARAEADGKLKMALVFKRYMFMGAQWAREGVRDRRIDYQIWCGPAMGAFNDWVRGSFLEDPANRTVEQIGLNILEGATQITRAQTLRALGLPVPPDAFHYAPRQLLLD